MIDDVIETEKETPQEELIDTNGYLKVGLEVLGAANPELADKIKKTRRGDSHLFTDDELGTIQTVLLDDYAPEHSNLVSGYAEQRWSDKKGSVSAYFKDANSRRERSENIAAEFWHYWPGKTDTERHMNRLNFYMNLNREEAERYANEHLIPPEKHGTYSIRSRP